MEGGSKREGGWKKYTGGGREEEGEEESLGPGRGTFYSDLVTGNKNSSASCSAAAAIF